MPSQSAHCTCAHLQLTQACWSALESATTHASPAQSNLAVSYSALEACLDCCLIVPWLTGMESDAWHNVIMVSKAGAPTSAKLPVHVIHA